MKKAKPGVDKIDHAVSPGGAKPRCNVDVAMERRSGMRHVYATPGKIIASF